MMLTQKRLELLAGPEKALAEYFVRKTIFDAGGVPVGAQVQILVPIL